MASAKSASMACRPGVERLGLERDVGPELVGEDPLLDADERGGVGDVGEVAEAEGDRLRCSTRPRSSHTRRAQSQRDDGKRVGAKAHLSGLLGMLTRVVGNRPCPV